MSSDKLERVFYVSRATAALTRHDVQRLVAQAEGRNRLCDVTGVLAYTEKHFAQVLEGRSADVQPLLARIGQDPRHEDVRLILIEPIQRRLFARWSMGYLHSLDLRDRVDAWLAAPLPLPQAIVDEAQVIVKDLPEVLML